MQEYQPYRGHRANDIGLNPGAFNRLAHQTPLGAISTIE